MIKMLETRFAAMAAFLAASVASQAAFAVVEIEGPLGNDTIARAQGLMISGGRVEVTGILGNGPLGVNDVVDFYSFEGHAGDVVTVDIDGGMKSDLSVGSSVDTTIAIFR